MPAQLTARAVTKAYNGRIVLDGVTCSIGPGERTGIIGENGSGKTTLLRLLAGREQPDDGEIVRSAEGGIGYLAQDEPLPPHLTVQDIIDRALSGLRAIESRMRRLEAAMASGDSASLSAYGDLMTVFELRGGYDAEARVERALHGLGLSRLRRDRTVGALSGGEQVRLRLASLLSSGPEVLLLDEPTNHLDDNALTWLEDHLRTRRGTTVAVSHDRVFLERTATSLLEVDADRRSLARYGNGYAGFLAEKSAARRRWIQAHDQWTADTVRLREAVATTARRVAPGRPIKDGNKMAFDRAGGRVQQSLASRVRNAEERLRRLLADPVPAPPEPLRFTPSLRAGPPPQEGGTGSSRSTLDAVGIEVDDRLAPVSLTLAAGDRLLITGPNGAGKSTLLRVLAGDLAPDGGQISRRGRIGYLPQETPVERPHDTLLEAFARGRKGPASADEHAERLLSLGLFAPERLAMPVGKLSTGQRQRLALARLLSQPVDILLLDEPTNHVSIALVEDLEAALAEFDGTLVVASHDRRLRQRWQGTHLALPAPQSRKEASPMTAGTPRRPADPGSAAGPVTHIPVADAAAGPYALTAGPDGALWITLVHSGEVARLTVDGQADSQPGGRVDRFALDVPACGPTIITPGPDGALWFTRSQDHRIGRITTDGKASSYPLPTPDCGPFGIVTAPDGALWFTQLYADRIGRITTDGEVREFPLPVSGAFPSMITNGPDGALWFTLNQADAVGRITLDGEVTLHSLPTEGAAPVGIACGGDGALWCVEIGAGQVARISAADGRVDEFPLPDRTSRPHAIVAGPEGACWFTEWGANRIASVTPAGHIEGYELPAPASEPHGIAVGPDGALYAALETGHVARLAR
ncbi:ATP-binding cassette domain-containing protein [Streptomyces sp. N2-109]|uniref:Virginiamycin B lyase n=2 Tax=Streptomyces gossypii TaxID=2883101 RepID=A0ABT2JYD4_9ACTN|nr:ATP-binding cassette domain-containing protein [Streptomyces gossypii]MCT2592881.1 ATP-binding cassette domain-containing protein [Streptomyces gossypii]